MVNREFSGNVGAEGVRASAGVGVSGIRESDSVRVEAIRRMEQHSLKQLAKCDNASGTSLTRLWLTVVGGVDLLGIGWALCNGSAQLLAANRTPQEILRCGDGLELNSHRVACTSRGFGQPLHGAVQQATTAGVVQKSESPDIALIVRCANGKGSLTVWVRPVTAFSRGPTSKPVLLC